MGAGRVVPGDRSKSHVSYYVAMVTILALLVVLCCYACYFFISKIKELSENESPSATPSTSCAKKEPVSYPVQPVVRDSATALVALCRQLPAAAGQDLVYPAPSSPDPRPAHTHPPPAPPLLPSAQLHSDKLPLAATEPCVALEAAS